MKIRENQNLLLLHLKGKYKKNTVNMRIYELNNILKSSI